MALKEQDIVFTTTDEAGNTVIQMPITRVENVEDAVRTVNKKKPDSNGDIQIDVDMSHLSTKEEVTQGLAKKREHTIQVANADLNTLLEDKTWACSGTLKNTPIACTFCIVQAYDTGAPVSGNIVQVCYIPNQTNNTVRAFWRNCLNGATFGAWSESGAVKTVNSVAPDTSGNVEIPAATPETYGLVRAATDATVIDEDADDAAITPAVYHDVSDFRHKNTAYALGDKVECMFNFELFLECTKAGTTSSTPLNTRTVKHGQVITDGTAEWTVRTHIRSINNAVADASGNITPKQTGCLPLAGGTMTDSIIFDSVTNGIKQKTDNIRFHIFGGTEWNKGAHLILMGKDNEGNGAFSLSTHDGEKGITLEGKSDGSLKWGNKDVDRVNSMGTDYIRYENGLQICFGNVEIPTGTRVTTVVLPVPFVSNYYSINVCHNSTESRVFIDATVSSASSFKCSIQSIDGLINWHRWGFYVAIGLWK